MSQKILEVKDLKTYYYTRRGVVKAVDGVSFSLDKGETLALVGESGCGKSNVCLSLVRLVPKPAGRIVGGQIMLNGRDILALSEKEMRTIRGKSISMILQDSMTSLNPVFTTGDQVTEAIRTHGPLRGRQLWDRAKELMRLVGISSPEQRLRNYPHQLSGGMRQRVAGAIAMSCEPQILIADEPTTSLDVTIQAQYLRLLNDIQQHSQLALLFVTHDFGIVAKMCHKVAVMYAGKIVEMAEVREIFNNPIHPYTAALMKSVPKVDIREDNLPSVRGQLPSLLDLPPGCAFGPRCDFIQDVCRKSSPPQVMIGGNHWVSCWRHAGEYNGSSA